MAYSQKEIFSGSTIYAVGQMLTKGSAFLLIPLYTRFLTPEDYGIVGYMAVVLQLGATVLLFGMHGAQTRFFYRAAGDEREIGEYLFSINAWLVGTATLVLVLGSVWGEDAYRALAGSSQIPFDPYVRIIMWAAVFQLFNQLIISFALARKEYYRSALLQVGLFICLTGFALYLVVVREQGALGQVRSLLYGNATFFALAVWQYLRHFRPRFRWDHVTYSLAYGSPLVIHLMAGVLLTSVDRIILERMVPLHALGLYTVAYQIGLAINVMNQSMNNAWQPSYFGAMEEPSPENDARVRHTYNLYAVVLTLVCVAGVVFGPFVYALVTPDSYTGGEAVVGLVMLGYFFNGFYFFASSPLFFFDRTKLLPLGTGTAIIVNVGLNLLLIPRLGILGAALATAAAYMVQLVVIDALARRVYRHRFDRRVIAVGASIMVGSMVALQATDDRLLQAGIGVVVLVGTALLLARLLPEATAAWTRRLRKLFAGRAS